MIEAMDCIGGSMRREGAEGQKKGRLRERERGKKLKPRVG